MLFDFSLFLTTELGRGRRWACNCEGHNFPQIRVRDNSNVKCKLKGEQGDTAAAKEEPALGSTLLPLGTPWDPLLQPEERGKLHRTPQPPLAVWHMFQSMTCFTHLLPCGLMETGFRETTRTFLGSHTHFQHLPCHVTACTWGCYDLVFFSGHLKMLSSKYSCSASE